MRGARLRTAEGVRRCRGPQVRGAGEPFRSSLMGFLDGNSEVLESLVKEMYCPGSVHPRCGGCVSRRDR